VLDSADDRRHRRRLCGVIFSVSIVLLRATFLLATELLLPLWRGLIFDDGCLSSEFGRWWLLFCHSVGLSTIVTTGLPPGWLIKWFIIINLRSRYEEVCVLSLWFCGITIWGSHSPEVHQVLFYIIFCYRKLKVSLGNLIGIGNWVIVCHKGHFRSHSAIVTLEIRCITWDHEAESPSAGSAWPHFGMGVRALPAAASQVTPSQAIAMFDDEEIVPETEMLSSDDAISNTANDIYAFDVEAAQPPNPTMIDVRDLIHITTITPYFIIDVILTSPWNSGHLVSRGWSCRDAGQHDANPGHPGKSGTGGHPKKGSKRKMADLRVKSHFAWRKSAITFLCVKTVSGKL